MSFVKKTILYAKKNGLKATLDCLLFVFSKGEKGSYIEHEVSIEESFYLSYESDYQSNMNYSDYRSDIRPIAFYLPQFHEIPENNEWWGEGYTEWRAVDKAFPRYDGHYEPRLPHADVGHYSLNDVSIIEKQSKLAKEHGIFGFCFYYYWFSGRKLLDTPINNLLQHPEIDTNFCVCWANENWTRTWSGNNEDVLIQQKYKEDDAEKLIIDLKEIITDRRYIRVDGKPVVLIYNITDIPEFKRFKAKMKSKALELGIGEILIWACIRNEKEYRNSNADGLVEFPPHGLKIQEDLTVKNVLINNSDGSLLNYQRFANKQMDRIRKREKSSIPIYRTCMMAWDNSPRRENGWNSFYAYSLKSFYDWTREIVNECEKRSDEQKYFFVNAWNEWSEGTYLEPDRKYGYANINTLSKALFKLPFDRGLVYPNELQTINEKADFNENVEIAVQVHIFYTETLENIKECLRCIPYRYDCYISTNSYDKAQLIRESLKDISATNTIIEVFENKGRDVMPFLLQMQNVYSKYKYICHLHSKKTVNKGYGDLWRDYLYGHLFGSSENVKGIINIFEANDDIGIIYPDTYPILKTQEEWGGNLQGVKVLLEEVGVKAKLNHEVEFPVGNMFWMRKDAIKDIFKIKWNTNRFPEEEGQDNLTIMHQVERIWPFIASYNGYTIQHIFNTANKSRRLATADKRLLRKAMRRYKNSYLENYYRKLLGIDA